MSLFFKWHKENNANNPSKATSNTGFTMIELLVVTTIIILLTTIGLVSYRTASMNARNGKRKADMEMMKQALVMYRTTATSYPTRTTVVSAASFLTDRGFLSTDQVLDPLNSGSYRYQYASDGTGFTLTAYLEPNATAWVVTNP